MVAVGYLHGDLTNTCRRGNSFLLPVKCFEKSSWTELWYSLYISSKCCLSCHCCMCYNTHWCCSSECVECVSSPSMIENALLTLHASTYLSGPLSKYRRSFWAAQNLPAHNKFKFLTWQEWLTMTTNPTLAFHTTSRSLRTIACSTWLMTVHIH